MTQVGDGPSAPFSVVAGEMLAQRYRLERHIADDGAGRQVWRGMDEVLRRPVAIVMRHPGGESAEEMLDAAVTASRVSHGNLVGVYDAIDEDTRAYVVREWIDGAALRELLVEEGNFDAERTTAVLHGVAGAVAALHSSGMAHGNVHPGTVLIANDGRVVLTDARSDGNASMERDVRAIGACGYFMLTGHWPKEGGRAPAGLADGRRDGAGVLAAPRQVRAGVPTYLDDLVMDLLNAEFAPPTSQVLAAELSRLDTADQQLFGAGPSTLRFAEESEVAEPSRTPTPKLVAVGGTALALVITGMVLGIKALNAKADPRDTRPSATQSTNPINPQPITLSASQVRIVDPKGDRKETAHADRMIDGNTGTSWQTNGYTRAAFGGSKPGMGILINLNDIRHVASVKVQLTLAGAKAQLRTGDTDPGESSVGDTQINETYTAVGEVIITGTTTVFPADLKAQYLLIWFTELPLQNPESANPYKIGVQEISVEVQ